MLLGMPPHGNVSCPNAFVTEHHALEPRSGVRNIEVVSHGISTIRSTTADDARAVLDHQRSPRSLFGRQGNQLLGRRLGG